MKRLRKIVKSKRRIELLLLLVFIIHIVVGKESLADYTSGSAGASNDFNGGTITTNLQVVGSITANAILVPPSIITVSYVNGTTTVTWANVNTPQIAKLTLAGATCTVSMMMNR